MRNNKVLPFIAVALLTMIWTGCEKDYNYVAPKVVIPEGTVVSFKSAVEPIFTNNGCNKSGCHDGSTLELDLTKNNAYDGLIGDGDINTGAPESSKLYVDVTAPVGSAKFMPKNGSPISATEVANILAWIKQGAKNN